MSDNYKNVLGMAEYYNEYNLTPSLSGALSRIISIKEENDYLCTVIEGVIPETEVMVVDNSVSTYIGPSRFHVEKDFSLESIANDIRYYKINPQEKRPYFVVIDKDMLKKIEAKEYHSIEALQDTLSLVCVFYDDYYGTIDANELVERFPYLSDFFQRLKEWRVETGRLVIDDEIINEAVKQYFPACKVKLTKKRTIK